jgi:elongation factor Ts
MSQISAGLVKELRERTGAGMMDCKRALEDANGDLELATRLLREKGMASAAKRAGRATTEGRVADRVAADGSTGTVVAVGCETEPVSKNDDFLAFVEQALETVARDGPGSETALEDARVALTAKLGENIAITGAARFEAVDGGRVASYVHPPGNKLGVLVQVRGGSSDLGRKLAMHIAASSPEWIGREDVPPSLVDSEREIFAGTDEVLSKPEQAREKIVDGMLQKRFFAARVLVDQPWIHDPSNTVGRALAGEGAEVLEFERLQLG